MIVGEVVLHRERICEVVEILGPRKAIVKTLYSLTGKPVRRESTREVYIEDIETRKNAKERLLSRKERCEKILGLLEETSPLAPDPVRPRHGEIEKRLDFSLAEKWKSITYEHGTTHHYLFYSKFPDIVAVDISVHDVAVVWSFFLPFTPKDIEQIVFSGTVYSTKRKTLSMALQEAKKIAVEKLLHHMESKNDYV